MATFNRTKTVARRHELFRLGHLPYLIAVIALIVGAVTWFFASQSHDNPVVISETYEQAVVELAEVQTPVAEKPISEAVVVEEVVEQVELDPFATSFEMLDVDWTEVKDLNSIPPLASDAPSYTYTGISSPETAEWASQFFPKLRESQFAGSNPVMLRLYEDIDSIAAFIDVRSLTIVNGFIEKELRLTWFILSEDNGKTWMQISSYPFSDELVGRLRVKETKNSIILYVKPTGVKPWMMTTIEKPLGSI